MRNQRCGVCCSVQEQPAAGRDDCNIAVNVATVEPLNKVMCDLSREIYTNHHHIRLLFDINPNLILNFDLMLTVWSIIKLKF